MPGSRWTTTQEHEVATRQPIVKRVNHPLAGPLEFECRVLHIPESGQRLIVYCAAPGSPPPRPGRARACCHGLVLTRDNYSQPGRRDRCCLTIGGSVSAGCDQTVKPAAVARLESSSWRPTSHGPRRQPPERSCRATGAGTPSRSWLFDRRFMLLASGIELVPGLWWMFRRPRTSYFARRESLYSLMDASGMAALRTEGR